MSQNENKTGLFRVYIMFVFLFILGALVIYIFGDSRATHDNKPLKTADDKCILFPLKHDFGKLIMGQVVSHDFTVRAPSGKGLWLGRIASPCDCVTLSARQKAWPNGVGVVTLRISTQDLYGKHDYPFFIEIIEPQKQVLKGTITVELPEEQKAAPVKKVAKKSEWITPAVMDFGRMREGQSATRTFTVKNLHSKPACLERLMSPCPCVTVSADKNILQPEETCTITVNMHSMSLNGKVEYPVLMQLVADKPQLVRGDLKIEVKRIPAKILLEPDILSMGKINKGQSRSVKLTNLQKKPLILQSVKCDIDGIDLQLPESMLIAPGKVAEIKLLSNGTEKGYFDGTLNIETDCNEHALIKLPIEGSF